MIYLIISNVIHYLHILLIFLLVFGSSLLPKYILKYFLFIFPIIFMDWTDDNECILSVLEGYFREKDKDNNFKWNDYFELPINERVRVFGPLMENLIGLKMEEENMNKFNTYLFLISWSIGYLRVANFLKYSSAIQ